LRPDIRWLAGFFDGEGSIGVYRTSGGGHNLKIQIVQSASINSERLFSSLRYFYGGNYSRHKTTHRPKFTYQIDAKYAYRFLNHIRPYLVFKAAQADVAIKWFENRPAQVRKKNGRLGTIRRAADTKTELMLKKMKREGR